MNKLNILKLFKNWRKAKKPASSTQSSEEAAAHQSVSDLPSYFQRAKSWADDQHSALVTSRQRYRTACWGLIGMVVLCVGTIMVLVPLQKTQLIIVHQGENGETWLTTTTHREQPPLNWARTQSEIAHYVNLRFAYDPLLYSYQTAQVKAMNSATVNHQFNAEQAFSNAQSPMNQLKADGYRTVTIRSVLPLSKAAPAKNGQRATVNLAQVHYEVTDHHFNQSTVSTTPYTALIAWQYHGVPDDPDQQLRNWDGFTVTHFDAAADYGSTPTS